MRPSALVGMVVSILMIIFPFTDEAAAEPIVYAIVGTIDSISGSTGALEVWSRDVRVGVGDQFFGVLRYDPEAEFDIDDDSIYYWGAFSYAFKIGRLTISNQYSSVYTYLMTGVDVTALSFYNCCAHSDLDSIWADDAYMSISYREAISRNGELPDSLSVNQFDRARFEFNAFANIGPDWYDTLEFEGTITAIDQTSLPEPATVLLLAAGLAVISGFRRKLKG